MDIVPVGPLRVASLVWQTGAQAWALTVVCKATFELAPGQSPLAEEQEPVTESDGFLRDDPQRSLHAPSDLAPAKPRADVVVVGSAYAPGGAPARNIVARITVGTIDKAVECYTERAVGADGSVQEGAGFARMSLLYERAAGGPGTQNPVGVRRDARDAYGRTPLPNLQVPGARVGRDVVLEPIGFGPISARWPERLGKLGRQASSWPAPDWANRAIPSDVDLGYFNAAPADQQLAALRDNERIVLENLHHEHPRLVTTLPGIHPVCFRASGGGTPFRVPMTADTLRIDTDRGTCTVTWRRQLPLDRPDERGRVVVAMEQPGHTLAWSDIDGRVPPEADEPRPASKPSVTRATTSMPIPPAPGSRPAGPPGTQTVVFAGGGSRDALPFQQGGPPSVPSGGPPAGIASPWASSASPLLVPTSPVDQPAKGLSMQMPAMAPASVAAPAPVAPPPPASVEPPVSVRQPIAGGASPWAAGAAAPSFARAVTPLRPESTPVVEPPKPTPAAAAQPTAAESNDILELLWFDAESVPRMRRNKAWKPVLAALEQRPVDRDLDDPALAAEPMDMEDRREVFEILARGAAEDGSGVDRALEGAIRSDGKFVPQLALVAGEIELTFDELESLKATVATAAPFVSPTDEGLKAAVEDGKRVLETADDLTPPSVCDAATKRVRTAFTATKRAVAETHLVETTDRVLLSQRRYEKRIVFGGKHLRFVLHADGADVPGYLPESLAKKLPMFQRFRTRMVVEVHQQADQYETHHASLRVVALARATPRRSR